MRAARRPRAPHAWLLAAGLALAAPSSVAHGLVCLGTCEGNHTCEDNVGLHVIVGGQRYELSDCADAGHEDTHDTENTLCGYTEVWPNPAGV